MLAFSKQLTTKKKNNINSELIDNHTYYRKNGYIAKRNILIH